METDPILESLLDEAGDLFEPGKADYDEAYGIGTWPLAVLRDVVTFGKTDFGFRLGLKLDLKGDAMPYTGRIDLPRTIEENGDHDRYDWQQKLNSKRYDVVNRLLAATGTTALLKKPIDDEDTYNKLVNVFRALIGNVCPVKVSADGKNKQGPDGKWTFEPNGFTRIDGIRPRK